MATFVDRFGGFVAHILPGALPQITARAVVCHWEYRCTSGGTYKRRCCVDLGQRVCGSWQKVCSCC